ncbi:MAG: S41 family peptidase [Prevotella intermedia]
MKNNFEKTLSALLFIVMCLYTCQTYAQMVNMTPYDSPVPDSLRLAPDGRMTKEQAIYDLNALVYTVSEVHPNMYAVCNQGEFMSRVNAIEQEMPDTITRATLYKYVAPLLALLGDGHTHVFPPYNDILTKTVLRFPLQGRVALMSFNDCTDPSGMTVFLDSMITEINAKKVQNLIIDVRKNDGGDSRIGDLIFERISKVPFQQFGKAFMRITPTTQRLLKNAYGDEFLSPTGLYLENEDSLNVPLNDKARCYNGKVWLLTSNYTFSSAASFSWAFKYFNMGKVVGEETGGMNVCFGDVLEYRLPISQLYCYMSHKRFWQYGTDETDIHGTIPDIAVSADKALETTLELIRKEK